MERTLDDGEGDVMGEGEWERVSLGSGGRLYTGLRSTSVHTALVWPCLATNQQAPIVCWSRSHKILSPHVSISGTMCSPRANQNTAPARRLVRRAIVLDIVDDDNSSVVPAGFVVAAVARRHTAGTDVPPREARAPTASSSHHAAQLREIRPLQPACIFQGFAWCVP